MIGWGVDIYAPRMPYVTTTVLLKRPVQRYVRPLLEILYSMAFGVPEARPRSDYDYGYDDPWFGKGFLGGFRAMGMYEDEMF